MLIWVTVSIFFLLCVISTAKHCPVFVLVLCLSSSLNLQRVAALAGPLWAWGSGPVPARCWASVVDGGPTFCLQRSAFVWQRTDVVLLLGRRPRRWSSRGAALSRGLGFARDLLSIFSYVGISGHRRLDRCWFGVGPQSMTLEQRWTGIDLASCVCW